MPFNFFKNTVFPITIGIVLVLISCGNVGRKEGAQKNEVQIPKTIDSADYNKSQKNDADRQIGVRDDSAIIVGANQTEAYLPILQGKRIGIVANQTSVIFHEIATSHNSLRTEQYTHLVDSLVSLSIDLKKVFAPEHGFRGTADAGEAIKDGVDTKTNLPIVSLYGDNKKPKPEQLKDLDLVIFDIQDVGARFYTYISTLHYVMEACAEAKIPVLILDRPNPNGHYIDGPILQSEHKSFVGMHPIPVVHGMTIGEYAQMINGEQWLNKGLQCELHIIKIKNYDHKKAYSLPIKPSPNLPNDQAINLYPSLCFFEGTNVNAGRGTDTQFQVYGSPLLDSKLFKFQYTPKSNEGAKYPKHQGKVCYGEDLTKFNKLDALNLSWLIKAYNNTNNKSEFFNAFFTKLAGTTQLQKQIEQGLSEKDIRQTWEEGLEKFEETRAKYLIYD